MLKMRTVVCYVVCAMMFAACTPAITTQAPVQPDTVGVYGKLIIYSGRSESLVRPVLDAFSSKYPNVEVLLKAGSNSEIANALIEEQANPQADIFITTELFTVQSLASKGLFSALHSADLARIPISFIGADSMWVGLTQRARVIMYNTDLVSADELPTSIFGLTDAKWKGKIAAAGSTNGSMQAQIAAMRALVGEDATDSWIKGLVANDVTFFGGHTDVRKAVGAGEFPLGLVNHYYYHLQAAEGSKVGVIYPDQGEGQIGLITNATAAAIVKGARNVTAAQAFVNFLVSDEGQKIFADLNYEYPLLPGVALRDTVQPLASMRLANISIAKTALEYEATYRLMEKNNLP